MRKPNTYSGVMMEIPMIKVQGVARVVPKATPPKPLKNRLRDWWDFATFRKAAWLAQAVGKAVDVLKDFLRIRQDNLVR